MYQGSIGKVPSIPEFFISVMAQDMVGIKNEQKKVTEAHSLQMQEGPTFQVVDLEVN